MKTVVHKILIKYHPYLKNSKITPASLRLSKKYKIQIKYLFQVIKKMTNLTKKIAEEVLVDNFKESYKIFLGWLTESLDGNVPNCTKQQRKHNVYMNREAIKIRNMKQKLWRKYTATRSITDYCKYVKCKNHLRKLKRDLRNKLEKSLANNSKTSPKPFWSYVKSKLKTRTKIPTLKKADGTKVRDAKDKAQALNVFFGSVYQQECNIIPPFTKNYNGIPLCSIKITDER